MDLWDIFQIQQRGITIRSLSAKTIQQKPAHWRGFDGQRPIGSFGSGQEWYLQVAKKKNNTASLWAHFASRLKTRIGAPAISSTNPQILVPMPSQKAGRPLKRISWDSSGHRLPADSAPRALTLGQGTVTLSWSCAPFTWPTPQLSRWRPGNGTQENVIWGSQGGIWSFIWAFL